MAEGAQGAQDVQAGPRGPLARLRATGGRTRAALVVAAVAVLAVVLLAWRYYAVRESTDDAQIDAHVSPVSARVGGTVLEVLVKDNQRLEKGALLVRIDPRDYQVALARAQADLAENEATARAARATVPLTSTTTNAQETGADSEVAGAEARLAAARAQLREAEARERQTAADVERFKPLLAKDEVSRQQFDLAATAADAARAGREAAAAAVSGAEKAVSAARARLTQARTGREQVAIVDARAASSAAKADMARAAVEQATLNLTYAEVRAPVAGIVSRRTVEVGQVVQAGQPLLALVDLDDVWVTANFKENQLASIKPGQPATVAVDAFGGRRYRGRVDSIAAATGARFSLLPPENATGNYVKVVQRVPVKIVLEPGQDREHRLRPGMSVVPTVLTR
jgi:membrane fusion protein (multidrug efflux system)